MEHRIKVETNDFQEVLWLEMKALEKSKGKLTGTRVFNQLFA
jgi:hypothetical protein